MWWMVQDLRLGVALLPQLEDRPLSTVEPGAARVAVRDRGREARWTVRLFPARLMALLVLRRAADELAADRRRGGRRG